MASFLHIEISGMTVNGRRVPDVNYTRTEHADGSVTEAGTRPPGVAADAAAGEVIGAAIDGGGGAVATPAPSAKRRRRARRT